MYNNTMYLIICISSLYMKRCLCSKNWNYIRKNVSLSSLINYLKSAVKFHCIYYYFLLNIFKWNCLKNFNCIYIPL